MNALSRIEHQERMKLTTGSFELLADSGSFKDHVRAELIDGQIWVVNALYRRHAYAHTEILVRLRLALAELSNNLYPLNAPSVSIPPHDQPEPDIVVTSEPKGQRSVPIETVQIAIEIADTSASFDLGVKIEVYAAAAIPEYWVFNLVDEHIHIFWNPSGGAYGERRLVKMGKPLLAETVAGLTIETTDLI